MSIPAHIEHTFRALDRIERPSVGTAGKSYVISHGQKDETNAGLGPIEAGPIVRYWTVKFERKGRTYYDHVIACDLWKASIVTMRRNQDCNGVQVVREIDRDEYEHLTRVSP